MIALDVSDDLFTPLCDGCAVPVRGGHRVTPTDVHCDLCGLRLYETVFQDKITFPNPDGTLREEVWVYVPTRKGSTAIDLTAIDLTAIDLTAVGRTGVGRTRDCDPLVDWENTKLQVHVPKSGLHELVVVPQPDMLPPHVNVRCQIPASVVSGLEPQGLRCSLKLMEMTTVQSNRIVRLIPRPLKAIEVVSPGRNVLESPVIAYMDATGGALLRLEVRAPESVVHVRRLTTPPDKRSALITDVRLTKESEIVPGINLRKGDCRSLVLRLKIDKPSDQPIPLRLDLDLLGLPLVPVDLNVLIRPAPELSFEPKTQPRHELLIGFTKGLTLFVAADIQYHPLTVEVSLKVDPADAQWIDFLVRPLAVLSLDAPVELYLEMRTSHLPRAAFDGRELSATVELRDQTGRVWKYPIRADVRRMPPMRAPLSLDWGTTNTCAAWHDGSDSRPYTVHLDPNELIASRRESFPSDIYFKDVSDPQNPVFLVGHDARNQSRNDQRGEALLISLKRRFARGGTVYVTDRAGKGHTYPVDDLVRRVIGKLVRMAELGRKEEVKTFSVTFPTKWPVQARRRLATVLIGVRDDLCSGNGGTRDVVSLSPRIDEANACVLNLLDELNRDGKLGEKVELVVAAYDFGGGTIDTSIVRVIYDSASDAPLQTSYIGVGGNAEFGGDDVTRAVLFLIESRLKPFLKDIEGLTDIDGVTDTNRRTYQLPLLPSGDSPPRDVSNPATWYEIGRRNWDTLWGRAELIKAGLCLKEKWVENKPPVEYYLEPQLDLLECFLSGGQVGDKFERQKLKTVLNTQDDIESALFEALEFDLNAVYAFESPTSVREQVESVARELADQCELAKSGLPDYVVVAGSGSRLPLAIESLMEHLRVPAERIIYSPDYLKQRVAHGNAWYASHAAAGIDLETGLCASVDILHRPLAVKGPLFSRADRIVVHTGVPIHSLRAWYDFPLAKYLVRAVSPREMTLLSVAWAGTRRQSSVLGAFDLEAAGKSLPGDDPTLTVPLPADLADRGHGQF